MRAILKFLALDLKFVGMLKREMNMGRFIDNGLLLN